MDNRRIDRVYLCSTRRDGKESIRCTTCQKFNVQLIGCSVVDDKGLYVDYAAGKSSSSTVAKNACTGPVEIVIKYYCEDCAAPFEWTINESSGNTVIATNSVKRRPLKYNNM